MVEAVTVSEQRVGHPGQIQQPIPVGIVPGKTGNLQRQNNTHLTQANHRGQLREPRTAGRAGATAAQISVDDPHRLPWPPQTDRPFLQRVLPVGGLGVAFHLTGRGLPDVHHRQSMPMRGKHFR